MTALPARAFRLLLAFALLAAAGARADAPADHVLSLVSPASTMRYHIVHKLHTVEATSTDLDGKAMFKADGTVQVMVRAKVSGFRSGDTNRDEHMMEVMEAASFPTVTFKGLAKIPPPASYPAKADIAVAGELELHGKKFPETINVHVDMTSATAWHVTGTFNVSLDKYSIERPALLLVKISDACEMALDLTLAGAK